MFSLMESMPNHEFIPFAVDFPQNMTSPYQPYFVSPPSAGHSSRLNDQDMSFWEKLRYAGKNIYSFEARKKLLKLIDDTQPQAALFLNAVYFSQSIIDACKKRNLPIIWRLSDFNLICGNYLFYRDGNVCTECVDSGTSKVLANRCGGYQKSFSAAMVRFLSMKLAAWRNIYRHVDYFVCPSKFMKKIMTSAGFSADKLVHIPTFVSTGSDEIKDAKTNQLIYVGRISPEKGVDVLLKAMEKVKVNDWSLIIAGGSDSDYAKSLIDLIPDSIRTKIHFNGFLSLEQVKDRIQESRFVVVPSVWYENMPNVVLEAMSLGRPVIASRLGSLEEMINHGETGFLFDPGSPEDLAEKITSLLQDKEKTQLMGSRARDFIKNVHSIHAHMTSLKKIFNSALKNRKG